MFQWSKKSIEAAKVEQPARRGMDDLTGQVAVISGSTSGIGLALARAVASRGGDVVLNGLGDPSEIERTRAEMEASCGVRVRYHAADMMRGDEVADMVAFAKHQLGRLDILVNNAGVQYVEAVEKFPSDQWERIIAINLSSTFYATRAAIPIMKAQGRGRIVNVASAHGLVASPFKSAYVAAKHGLVGFTKSVALELAETGVTVNAICPGYVRTPLVEGQVADQAKVHGLSEAEVVRTVILSAQPTRRFIEPAEVGAMALFLCSEAGRSITGAALAMDGGWTAR
jgi:3-hydroxybutyrate dehydrogenase